MPTPLAVVVIGPECTGKTALAGSLARAYDAPWSAEYAREYAEAAGRPLGPEDVEPIAHGQRAGEDAARDEALARGTPLVVHDTDLASTVVYARHYYGSCPAWIPAAARERRAALYLLSAPDVPWVDDAVRDTPAARAAQYEAFRETLQALGARVAELRGTWAEREAAARAAIDGLLGASAD